MSRILGFSSPFAGHLFPMIGMLLELQKRGHDAVLAVGPAADGLDRVPAPGGGRVWPIDTWISSSLDFAALGGSSASAGPASRPGLEKHLPYGESAAADLAALIVEDCPDYLLIDPMLWGAMPAAEASGLPWAVLAYSSGSLPTLGPRLFGRGLPPPNDLRSWLQQYDTALAFRSLGERNFLPSVNRVRATQGLGPITHIDENFHAASLIIACTAEPFEYPRADWHPRTLFVGPIDWDVPGIRPAWLDELDERPAVLVCTSSIAQADHRIVETALAGLADADVQIVVTVPAASDFLHHPPNARVLPFTPHHYLLPHTACVVCHGGLGLTQKALAFGVPVVACPTGRDQLEVARRVEQARAGVYLKPEELSPGRMREAVSAAFALQSGAERVAEAFRHAGGAPAAAIAIEATLRITRPPRATSPSAEEANVRRLEREVKRITDERDLLYKAAALFARRVVAGNVETNHAAMRADVFDEEKSPVPAVPS